MKKILSLLAVTIALSAISVHAAIIHDWELAGYAKAARAGDILMQRFLDSRGYDWRKSDDSMKKREKKPQVNDRRAVLSK
jgi:hypothetical protein